MSRIQIFRAGLRRLWRPWLLNMETGVLTRKIVKIFFSSRVILLACATRNDLGKVENMRKNMGCAPVQGRDVKWRAPPFSQSHSSDMETEKNKSEVFRDNCKIHEPWQRCGQKRSDLWFPSVFRNMCKNLKNTCWYHLICSIFSYFPNISSVFSSNRPRYLHVIWWWNIVLFKKSVLTRKKKKSWGKKLAYTMRHVVSNGVSKWRTCMSDLGPDNWMETRFVSRKRKLGLCDASFCQHELLCVVRKNSMSYYWIEPLFLSWKSRVHKKNISRHTSQELIVAIYWVHFEDKDATFVYIFNQETTRSL